ncbi:hypothetical protein L1987_14040 [Smallanthus sonchifolius]|uniref:Uncharacterized protein n=1 Tax=Smallanthus sonchifolius TaxID=185202 RepID=A0ACB9JLP0_9ASTR|nr:hypothetical protein L1987_14040 [Smallanthus sonchifolius]
MHEHDPDSVYLTWLRSKFNEFVQFLIQLSVSPTLSEEALREVVVDTLMECVMDGNAGKFHSSAYHKFIHTLLYSSGGTSSKSTQKITLEVPRRSDKARVIHILPCNEGGNSKCIGKMNFVDLAGYENSRRNSTDGTNFIEGTQINKSLNALFNVIHGVNANEARVPYRESKLARVLQDSLGGNNHIFMIVCLIFGKEYWDLVLHSNFEIQFWM